MKSVIKIEKPEHITGTEQARHDWGKVTGKELTLKPATFLHVPTGEYYCHLIGGIAYPTATVPGIVILLGIQSEPNVKFRVLETFEDINVFKLIEQAVMLRSKYGFGLDSRLLPYWYGDQEKFQTLIIKTSEALEKKLGYDRGFYIKDTVDLRERHSFPLYVRQIFNCLETNRLDMNSDDTLIGHLQSFQREDAEKGRTENYPATGLIGGMVHSLQIEKPWLDDNIQGEAFNIAV